MAAIATGWVAAMATGSVCRRAGCAVGGSDALQTPVGLPRSPTHTGSFLFPPSSSSFLLLFFSSFFFLPGSGALRRAAGAQAGGRFGKAQKRWLELHGNEIRSVFSFHFLFLFISRTTRNAMRTPNVTRPLTPPPPPPPPPGLSPLPRWRSAVPRG